MFKIYSNSPIYLDKNFDIGKDNVNINNNLINNKSLALFNNKNYKLYLPKKYK